MHCFKHWQFDVKGYERVLSLALVIALAQMFSFLDLKLYNRHTYSKKRNGCTYTAVKYSSDVWSNMQSNRIYSLIRKSIREESICNARIDHQRIHSLLISIIQIYTYFPYFILNQLQITTKILLLIISLQSVGYCLYSVCKPSNRTIVCILVIC